MGVTATNRVTTVLKYVVLILVGIIMVYPLLWMVSATFKPNSEVFTNIGLIPKNPTFDGYVAAMKDYGGDINIVKAMLNTYKFVIPRVVFTAVSSLVTAYGFSRFEFKGRSIMFAIMIGTLFLPQVVLNVPQYLMYNNFKWIDSPYYLSLIVPSLFAVESYFVFMMVQFMRNIPRELDEAAQIDGCNSFVILTKIITPMMKPSIVSSALFQFMWSSNDYMGPLLYIKTPARYAATIFVRLSMDAESGGFAWNRILAISLISIIPSLVIFFIAQDQFIDGIADGGVKG